MPGAVIGDFTPFGYLRNPGHRATSWRETSGGNLRTAADWVGMEWVYPVGRDPTTRIGLGLQTTVDGRLCRTRRDFQAIGLTSRHHSCLIFGFDWQIDGLHVEARYFLVDDDALCVRISLTNRARGPRHVQIGVFGFVDGDSVALADQPNVLTQTPATHVVFGSHEDFSAGILEAELAVGAERRFMAILSRGTGVETALATGAAGAKAAEGVYERLLAEDARFYASCPVLNGDWPTGWREGLAYDFETTRLLVQPARGIFGDVWPSWMASWPRVVLAEGVLDMQRLAYADPALAQQAVLSLFRFAPQPNVPCVFENGEYNMVAADGSRCGTSPAWCLPFLNLELLYLRSVDREWLRQVYPYASAYLSWWLDHRVDADGWVVYKCTWESGEDGNPRLDPTGSGDADISRRVRPVELQATLAHAARVLSGFADELGLDSDGTHWRLVEATYRDRTRQLFDAQARRYRDWLVAEQRFAEASPEQPYWGIDPGRFSAQSLTPLLIGEPLAAEEVWQHACPPWTLWPSWTMTLVEAAAAAGLTLGVGELAFETIDRVYRITTRRELGSVTRPMPGGAPEFWPQDWRTYDGNDAYGWGASTANLLIRHLFGFKESRSTDGWIAELMPAFPRRLVETGRQYGIRQLNYRGLIFDLTYTLGPDAVTAELDLGAESRECWVAALDGDAQTVFASRGASSSHRFHLKIGRAYALRLG